MKYLITVPALCLLLLTLNLLKVTNAGAGPYPVTATIAGMEINTTVDSHIARQVLSGNSEQVTESIVSSLAIELTCDTPEQAPNAATMATITAAFSVDTAAAVLARCLYQIPQVRKSQQLFLAELDRYHSGATDLPAHLADRRHEYVILVVPGWGYLSSSEETGADLRKPRKIISDLGFDNHLVPIEDTGSVETSAAILVATLAQYLPSGKKIIMVSASSGGPTVALALGDPAIANHPAIAGWLNICGVLRGSPVIDTFVPWPKSLLLRTIALFEGWHFEDLISLSQQRSGPRYSQFVAPEQLTIVNYIGIPFSGQVNSTDKGFYGMLAAQGPNDGLTLIADALAPGYTIMAIGSDHFINDDPLVDSKTAVLLSVILQLIEENRNQAPSFAI